MAVTHWTRNEYEYFLLTDNAKETEFSRYKSLQVNTYGPLTIAHTN